MITNPHSMSLDLLHKTKTLFRKGPPKKSKKQAQLTLFDQGFPKKTIPIIKEVIEIGFDLNNDIHLQDPYISAHHCKLEYKNGVYFLKDLDSRNGTFLNQTAIKETILQNKNFIQLGKTLIQFEIQEVHKKNTNNFHGIISKNPLMHHIFSTLQKVSPLNNTVMIYGETGTGKELIAKAIHKTSNRADKPFVVVNCGAIPRDLIESELFGHITGAFTGAHKKSLGSFAAAHGGTLFLDEIGELPLELQPKLLRAIEEKEIKPVGSQNTVKVDVRIVTATHRDLSNLVKQKKFREDLFYRLHVIPLYLPPLRERKEDLSELVGHFTNKTPITSKALKLLQNYGWPGNIRELKNITERLLVMKDSDLITEREVRKIFNSLQNQSFSTTLKHMEKEMLLDYLEQHKWNRTETANALGMPKTTLLDKIRRFKLKPSRLS